MRCSSDKRPLTGETIHGTVRAAVVGFVTPAKGTAMIREMAREAQGAPTLDRTKFQNTVLYILTRCSPTRPGVTSLLKLLWFADYEHYRQFLTPITGARYVALPRGPVVDGYKELFASLESEGFVVVNQVAVFGRRDKKSEYVPKCEPDVAVFTATERRVLDAVVREHGADTGIELSEKTHLDGPWSFVWNSHDQGREIPYTLFRWLDNMPDEEDLAAATKQMARPAIAATLKALNSNTAH